jgi:hypothetical protein
MVLVQDMVRALGLHTVVPHAAEEMDIDEELLD